MGVVLVPDCSSCQYLTSYIYPIKITLPMVCGHVQALQCQIISLIGSDVMPCEGTKELDLSAFAIQSRRALSIVVGLQCLCL